MAHVVDVNRSVEFYKSLGFELVNTFTPPDESEPSWAYLESNQARLMVTKSGERVIPGQQAVLFYLYFDEIREVHAELKAAGFKVSTLTFPSYCPDGEFSLTDPDGYCLMLTHT